MWLIYQKSCLLDLLSIFGDVGICSVVNHLSRAGDVSKKAVPVTDKAFLWVRTPEFCMPNCNTLDCDFELPTTQNQIPNNTKSVSQQRKISLGILFIEKVLLFFLTESNTFLAETESSKQKAT